MTMIQLGHRSAVHRRYVPADLVDAQCRRRSEPWLSASEEAEQTTFRNARRRREWLWGRMVAKQLICMKLQPGLDLANIEILSQAELGRPRIWRDGVEQPWSMSISHTDRGVLVALSSRPGISVGVDLTPCEMPSAGFIRLWFTRAEINWLEQDASAGRACFLWAAKEALYKACHQGQAFDPRRIEVLPATGYCFYDVPLVDCRLQSWSMDGQVAVLATSGPTKAVIYQQEPATSFVAP